MTKTNDVSKLPVLNGDPKLLLPDPRNAKKHPADHLKRLGASISKLGMANPIQVRPNMVIIAGHGRREAAILEGWTSVPYVIRTDLTDAEADALAIADNKTSSTDYDFEKLAEMVGSIQEEDMTLIDGTGLNEKEIEMMTVDIVEMNEDALVDDITEAVEEQKAENAAAEAAVDAAAAPVGDALGFKRLTIEQSRTVRAFMTKIEEETGKKGAEALVHHIAELGYAA